MAYTPTSGTASTSRKQPRQIRYRKLYEALQEKEIATFRNLEAEYGDFFDAPTSDRIVFNRISRAATRALMLWMGNWGDWNTFINTCPPIDERRD